MRRRAASHGADGVGECTCSATRREGGREEMRGGAALTWIVSCSAVWRCALTVATSSTDSMSMTDGVQLKPPTVQRLCWSI